LGSFAQEVLLNAFRTHYHRFQAAITDLVGTQTDAIVISRLGDDLDEFADINQAIFPPEEFTTLETSLAAMRLDIRLEYQDAVDASHHGRPVLVQTISPDGPGRPRIYIDPDFLRWAYGQRSTASISRFLGVGRTTVRNALIAHGIVEPQQNPFQQADDSLDTAASSQPTTSFTGPLSDISDDDLDMLLLRLRTHYRRAVIHGFIDGYSRLITGLRASDNNTADTVLELFLDA
ncbi:hypothetical protein K438DRAFT_1456329, partial [Mycena galopus ATCC 62051]